MLESKSMTETQNTGLGESMKSLLSYDYKGKRFIAPIAGSFLSEVKFRTNQLLHLTRTNKIGEAHPEIGQIGSLSLSTLAVMKRVICAVGKSLGTICRACATTSSHLMTSALT